MNKIIGLSALRDLAARALAAANASPENARIVAEALVAADADGLSSHGVSRVPFYADQSLAGKVNGRAVPEAQVTRRATVLVDARDGYAFPAIRLGLDRGLALLDETGVVAVGVTNSHHAGATGHHVELAAERGALAIGFANSPSAMAPWGGSKGTFGTNPIAFACPRVGRPPLVIDLSLSKVARGKVMVADKKGESIPAGWALDPRGEPTTDPKAALAGTMVPIGDAKGAALALMVEILSAAVTGAHFAYQASSFFDAKGPPPRTGQFFLLIDARAFAGDRFGVRMEELLAEIASQPGTRLPGDRRLAEREKARREGVSIPEALHEELLRRAS